MVMIGPRLWGAFNRVFAVVTMPVYDQTEPVYDQPVSAAERGGYTNVIFLHHSTGRGLIVQGNVRALLTERGYQFWDHDYNDIGLTRPDGTLTGAHYRIPGALGRGNTDVDGLVKLFSQPVTDPPTNAFSRLLQHEIVVFKSCFPNSAIKSDEMQEQFQTWYLQMRDVMDQHPDRLFILVTSPPLHPRQTNGEEARRARAIADWLKSDAYLAGRGHKNVFVFDFFDLLADPDENTLRAAYQLDREKPDSHPNQLANETIGPLFVQFIDDAVQAFRGGR
ncbi:MAG: hypothetical protein JXA89_23085 [Anaerolineae bacterium]|nr:hypothetical protein [Anaerolineae bacterium]